MVLKPRSIWYSDTWGLRVLHIIPTRVRYCIDTSSLAGIGKLLVLTGQYFLVIVGKKVLALVWLSNNIQFSKSITTVHPSSSSCTPASISDSLSFSFLKGWQEVWLLWEGKSLLFSCCCCHYRHHHHHHHWFRSQWSSVLRYDISKYQEILTDTDQNILIQYLTLIPTLPISSQHPSTPHILPIYWYVMVNPLTLLNTTHLPHLNTEKTTLPNISRWPTMQMWSQQSQHLQWSCILMHKE